MKVAVYTAIFGDKDHIKEPVGYSAKDNIDYFLITDNLEYTSTHYKIINRQTRYPDVAKNARYYKLIGLQEFNEYDYVIWHDANLQLLHNSIPQLVTKVQKKQLAIFRHPKRTNFYDEAIACIIDQKEGSFKVFQQCLSYFFKNTSPYTGLYETSILVKNNQKGDSQFYNIWWKEIKRYSRRDQISLPYIIEDNEIQLGVLEGERLNSPYAIYHEHNYDEYLNSKQGKNFIPDDWIIKWLNIMKRLSRKIHKRRIRA